MNLTPKTLDNYIGQAQIKKNLRTILDAKKSSGIFDPPIDHILFSGYAGLGKTALAEIVANELKRPLIKFMGPHLRDVDTLDALRSIRNWSFIFIDEIHSLPLKVEEALYEPMDEFKWKDQKINSFTLIGATTKEGLISKPLRSRFTIVERLAPYTVEDIGNIIRQKATTLGLSIDDGAVKLIAQRSKGIPREAIQLLKRTSYYSAVITSKIAGQALDDIGIDCWGLDSLDHKIIKVLSGEPMGIDSLSSVLNEDAETIEVREYYLASIDIICRTPRGRKLTEKGIRIKNDTLRY